MVPEPLPLKGRGSHIHPANRFEAVRREDDWEHLEADAEAPAELNRPTVEYLPDASQSIVAENNSPDIPFRYSVNPYRGCARASRIATPGQRTSIWGSTPGWISRRKFWSSTMPRHCSASFSPGRRGSPKP